LRLSPATTDWRWELRWLLLWLLLFCRPYELLPAAP
jgi:hypothetical protein